MARPQIWQRGQTGSYYATIGGKQVLLGRSEGEAQERYDYLIGVAGIQSIGRVDDLLDAFLEWVNLNRSKATYAQYRELLQSFNRALPTTLRICDLKPFHLTNWLDGQAWNTTTKNKAVGAVKRAFNWAIDQGHINLSPIARVKKPPVRNREALITPKLWKRIGETVKDRAFRDLLMILRETGCRPYEARTVCACHVRKDAWLFAKVDSKGEKYNRLVPLNEIARRITTRLAKQHPTGPLFRNQNGDPWTKDAIVGRFKRLSKKLQVPIYAYCLRHTFCTEALERGVDSTTAAILMGHRDTTMVARVYSHLTGNKKHLQAALKQARGGGAAK
jgi:integrase